LEQYGPNQLGEQAGPSRRAILIRQLTGVMTLILVAAAAISVFLGDVLDAVVILAIVALNAILGFVQEYRAEKSIAGLKQLSTPTVRVRRDDAIQEIPSPEVVPGDVVLLETGNMVPADARLLHSSNLRVQEAALTGESEAVEKDATVVFSSDRALGDRRNLVYSGTIVTYGHGEVLVTATGMETELGRIAGLIQAVEPEHTPLQKRLDRLGKVLAAAAIALVVVVFILGVLRGEDWRQMLLTSVSLAVAAIPEALTAVVTIALSLGAQRMLKRRALIRQLPAVETLGSVSVICSDKTGTLTQNQMTVTVLDIANHRVDLRQRQGQPGLDLAQVGNGGWDPGIQPTIDLLLIAGALCNDSILQREDSPSSPYRTVGDPTEGALVLAAAQAGLLKDDLDRAFPRVAELPFDSVRKRMTTVHRVPGSRNELPPTLVPVWDRADHSSAPPAYLAATKGALDGLLAIAASVWIEGQT
jgi:Ca2+-transporting ATPase